MRFGVLGPLTVSDGEDTVVVGPPKQRALLAALLVARGHPVSTERLCDQLWPVNPPATAAAALQVHVAAVRKLVGERLITGGSGYRLEIADDDVDAACFESHIGQARAPGVSPDRAVTHLRAALALWRGEAFEAVPVFPAVAAAAARLTELRMAAQEQLAGLELARGRHREVVAELAGWVAEAPAAERLVAGLMLALHRCGRDAEALAAYQRLRERLDKDLSTVEQGEAAQLAAAIRRRDPTIDAVDPHLPVAGNRFIGRRGELEHAAELLGESRLLTITGPGGCGKTRFAVELARDMTGVHPDGVRVIELAGQPSAGATEDVLAGRFTAALNARDVPGRPAVDTLLATLADQRLLLVVDNCEHLLGPCARLLGAVLAGCPGVRLLATSREPLGLAGEVVLPIGGLAVPDLDEPLQQALRADAARLFAERVRQARGGAALRPDEWEGAVRLCRRLDGLPLAIELAAARLRALPLQEVTERLDRALDLLVGPAAGRHSTMRAAIDWSHNLLDPPERTVLRRLSVLAGAFDLATAQQIGADPERDLPREPEAVLDSLTRLVDRSMVSYETGAERPYRLIATLREYAVDQLGRQEEYAAAKRRHAAWCLALASPAAPVDGPAHAAWLRRMAASHDDIREALRWTLGEGKDAAAGLAIATAMWWYWWVAGQMSEGRTWLDQALASADPRPSAERGQALRAAAALARNNGDLPEARRLGAAALAVFEQLGDRAGIISAGNNLAITAQAQGDYDASLAYGFEALRRATDDGLDRAIAMTLNNTAGTLRCMDRLDEAEQMFQRALALFTSLSDGRGEAAALTNLAVVARRRGDLVTAHRLTLQFLTLYHMLDIAEGQLDGVEGLACIAAARGRAAEALHLLTLAARERIRLGAPIFTPDELAERDNAESTARQALTLAQQKAAAAAAAQDTLAAAVHRLLASQPGDSHPRA